MRGIAEFLAVFLLAIFLCAYIVKPIIQGLN